LTLHLNDWDSFFALLFKFSVTITSFPKIGCIKQHFYENFGESKMFAVQLNGNCYDNKALEWAI